MTKERFKELHSAWDQSDVYKIARYYADGHQKAAEKAMLDLTRKYKDGTFMGSPEGALATYQYEADALADKLAVKLRSMDEFDTYMKELGKKDPKLADALYSLDLFDTRIRKRFK